MQHFFSHLAEGFAVKLFVELPDRRVFMALSQGHLRVFFVKAVDAGFSNLIGILHEILRLTAATDTSAGAGHDLYKMILLVALFHALDHLSRIGSAVDDCHIYIQLADL